MFIMTYKILHLIESAGLYGAESVILTLAEEQQKNSNFSPVIGCIVNSMNSPSALFDEALKRNILAIKFVMPVKSVLYDVFPAAKKLKKENISIIHTHGYKPSVFGFLLAKISRTPIISTCHNWILPESGPLKMRLMIRLEKYFYRYFNAVVAVSDPIKNILFKSNIPKNIISLIPNGISIPSFKEHTDTNKFNDKESPLKIINVARLSTVKGQTYLIDAIKILNDMNIPVQLSIVGDGPLTQELQDKVLNLSLQERVKFLGFRTDITELLKKSDVFTLSSIDEGMPMSLLEAVSLKIPVVATQVGNIPALILDQNSGLLAPVKSPEKLAEAFLFIYKNKDKADLFAKNAFTYLTDRFSAKAMESKYSSIYLECISNE